MGAVALARTGHGHEVRASVLPDAGGALVDLTVDGLGLLARTPWAETVLDDPSPAPDEAAWVGRWRGGWQLCFPSAGAPESQARPSQGFHGTASQAPWRVVESSGTRVRLSWADDGLEALRTWSLEPDGARVSTTVRSTGRRPRSVIAAEHLVLGSDLLAPVLHGRAELVLEAPDGTEVADLDYDGRPRGRHQRWPGDPSERWARVGASTPARVAALVDPDPRRVRLAGPAAVVEVTWEGLPHALLWQELARSTTPPWDGQVVALGVEPTTTAHGAGTGAGGAVTLAPGGSMTWSTRLRVLEQGRSTP